MAQENKDLQEINKGIQQIVKVLSMGVSPADAKKIAEMEAETAKVEKTNAGGKKKDDKERQEWWSDNIKTWSQLGKFMTKGVKSWFNKAMKANNLLGSTLRLGANIWKNLNEHIIQNLKNAFGSITSHVKEVLGPVAEAFDAIKNVFSGVFKFFKGTFLGVGAKVKPEDKFRNKMLQKMLKYLKPKDTTKAAFAAGLDKKKEKSGWTKFLLILGVILAAMLGAAVRKFLMPFEIMGKMIGKSFIGKTFMKLINFFRKIGAAVKSLSGKGTVVGKFFKAIGKLFGWIGKAFNWIKGIVVNVIKWVGKIAPAAGGLAKLGRAFMYGFKILGWPLTIFMGIFDFIQGFRKTEGTLWEKIKGGFMAALMGLIEMPIRFIMWLVEKVLGFFGVEVSGLADSYLGWIKDTFDALLDLALNLPLVSFLVGFFGTEGTFMEKLKGGFVNMVKGLITLFATIWNFIVDLAYKLLPDWVVDKIGMKKMQVPGKSADTGGSASDADKKNKDAQAAAKKKEMEDAEKARLEQEKIAKAQLTATEAAGMTTAAAVGGQGGQGGQGGGDIPQIPDEVDNWGVTSKNYDMEMS